MRDRGDDLEPYDYKPPAGFECGDITG